MSATCPNCGKPVPASALEGLCPECMLRLGAASQTEALGETAPGTNKPAPPPPPSPEEIARFFPHLEILECLGRGGMGVVYKARQTLLNRLVALKILAPEKEQEPQFAERFMREAQALARLNHPHIVTVYDFGETSGLYYLLMEYVDGMNLRQLLQTRKLVPEEALAIVPPICEALQYAHELGIVHRDVKPENVLLDKRGKVKIADFGIAKILGQAPNQSAITGAKEIIGTPYYMAPEQVEKPTKVDHRADIYSLGVVFYEMLTGELPLGKFAPPSRKSQIDARLDRVVLHALEKEPERRYQHASQVKTDLETITHPPPAPGPVQPRAADNGPKSVPVARVPDAATSRRLARRIVFVLLLLTLGCIGLAMWLQRPRPVGGIVAADSPDGRYCAMAGTRNAMRIFGGDRLFFRCSVLGQELHENWDVPVPTAKLETDYVRKPISNYSFEAYGAIRWSADSQRVSFLVRGIEVAGFNVESRSHSLQGGFQPERVPQPELALLQPTSVVSNQWTEALVALNTAGWREAFALGQKIAALPPDEGYEVLSQGWGAVANIDARQQLLKAFFFVRNPPPDRFHPRLFDVLDLGMRDRSPAVQGWSINYLKQIVLRDFANDFPSYEKWYKANAGRPVADILRDAFNDFLASTRTARPAEIANQLDLLTHSSPWRVLLTDLDPSQLSDLKAFLENSARNKTNTDLAQNALQAIAELPPDEAYLRRVVLPLARSASSVEVRVAAVASLGKPECAWALDFLEKTLQESLEKTEPAARIVAWKAASGIAGIGEPRSIPLLIGVIDADNTYDTVYGVGYFGLGPLTGVTYSETHDGAWWRAWWERNKIRFPEDARTLQIPTIRLARKRGATVSRTGEVASDVADVPCRELLAANNRQMQFFLIGLDTEKPAPASGYPLLLVLPGGDGSSNFLNFVKRIYRNAVPKDYLVAELVAPQWDKQQAKTLVWPLETDRYPGMKFPTEAFIHAVIAEVEKHHRLDQRRIFTLTWSSSGPAGYAASLYPNSRITGSFIAMSVFRPNNLPDLAAARGRAFYLLHSPQDQLIPLSMPTNARERLTAKGARVKLTTYDGGHGWHGDVYGMIRSGIDWCEENCRAESK